jgi:amino acid transporter
MNPHDDPTITAAEDEAVLRRLGYAQELRRGMSAFSNFAVSLSIICILAGGVTSFHVGLCSVGGASIGLGWPLCCAFSLLVALTMAQVASTFPTAGGLYHWAAILGGRGWGWATAWFNLAGLITVLAAINAGTYQFVAAALGPHIGHKANPLGQALFVVAVTVSQAAFNHFGIRLATRLIDFSGYWILFVAVVLTAAMVVGATSFEPSRLITFNNFSGLPVEPKPVWPQTTNVAWLFLLGLLLPAYTLTGFDASAHTAEETVGAAANVPRGIVRSVLVSGLFGWVMLCAVVLAAPNLRDAAAEGDGAFVSIVNAVFKERPGVAVVLFGAIALAQYLCGLATITSASRMLYAFARDGGVPGSAVLRHVHTRWLTPVPAIWLTAALSVLFTISEGVYETISSTCTVLLYISYVLPTALGSWAYGRTWTKMGPWSLGAWYRPLAVLCVLGCGVLFVIGLQALNILALCFVFGFIGVLPALWFAVERRRFRGPPNLSVKE